MLLIDPTSVECARSRETFRRSALGAADHDNCSIQSRSFWKLRPGAVLAAGGPPGTAVSGLATTQRAPGRPGLPGCCQRSGGEVLLGDKGDGGCAFAAGARALGATLVRPALRDEPTQRPHRAPTPQRTESMFFTCRDPLALERHGARTLAGPRERIVQRFPCPAVCVWLNHQLVRPSRSLVAYAA